LPISAVERVQLLDHAGRRAGRGAARPAGGRGREGNRVGGARVLRGRGGGGVAGGADAAVSRYLYCPAPCTERFMAIRLRSAALLATLLATAPSMANDLPADDPVVFDARQGIPATPTVQRRADGRGAGVTGVRDNYRLAPAP